MNARADLELLETRMEQAFSRERFDTFNQLAAERMALLRVIFRKGADPETKEEAHRKTLAWVAKLEHRLEQGRVQIAVKNKYGMGRESGSIFNRMG